MAKKVKRNLDKKIFKRTASRTKKINLGGSPMMRGGIRF